MSSVMRFDQWQDSNGNAVATGTGGVFSAPGSVLQVVQIVKTDAFSTTSTSLVDVTGLSVSITPSSASNKILVLLDLKTGSQEGSNLTVSQLVRDATAIYQSTAGAVFDGSNSSVADDDSVLVSDTSIFLDSPATTSSVTYKVQIKTGTSAQASTVNKSKNGSTSGGASSITVMEVAA